MQPIDYTELVRNRGHLIQWQREKWLRKDDGLRLHLGSGKFRLQGYVNIDLYSDESDRKEDIRYLSYEPNTVKEIICQHVLEHLPIRDVYLTLKRWYDMLMPGGTIELGLPDIELTCQGLLEAQEKDKWSKYIWKIYGGQTDDDKFSMMGESDAKEWFEFAPGQVHMSGFSLGYLVRIVEDIGYKVIEAYNYDAFGSPSLLIYATKPDVDKFIFNSILEKDVAVGVFTNKTTFLPSLWASARKQFPQIPFITRIQRGPINKGMSLLRDDFIKSGKRFWVFLDDDIQFLNPDIIKNALELMVREKLGCVSAYSTFDPQALNAPYSVEDKKEDVVTRLTRWATGYFIMIDSMKVGHILPDMQLPDPNTAVDTSYSVAIRAAGYDIGISGDYVYHLKKQVFSRREVIEITNNYLINKWGNFYFDWAKYDYNVIDEGWKRKGCQIK